METIRDNKNRKICELDPHKQIIVIKYKGSKTSIVLKPDGKYKVIHTTE